MQNFLQRVQLHYRIYNSDLEPPEHDTDFYCACELCQYKRRKIARLSVQQQWSHAVMYPGEKAYSDVSPVGLASWRNPYVFGVVSPYGLNVMSLSGGMGQYTSNWTKPIPRYHAQAIQQTIRLNASLNQEAQRAIDAREPRNNIWSNEASGSKENKGNGARPGPSRNSRLDRAKSILHIKSAEEKAAQEAQILRDSIVAEELGRWPDEQTRNIVGVYQEKMGMAGKIMHLRTYQPTQYLHLLRAGYFEPIPVAWADSASNPLKFTVDAAAGQCTCVSPNLQYLTCFLFST